MANKSVRQSLKEMDYYDVLRLKKDLNSGSKEIKKMIDEEIFNRQNAHDIFCASCGAKIDIHNENTLTLIFGSDDFKKKASFCGKDCLKFFIENDEN